MSLHLTGPVVCVNLRDSCFICLSQSSFLSALPKAHTRTQLTYSCLHQLGQSDGRSAGLTLNLSSNNPFRNRAASPNSGLSPNSNTFSPPPPHSPFDDPPPERPVSRNPFFDPSDNSQHQRVKSPASMASANENRKSPTAEELFVSSRLTALFLTRWPLLDLAPVNALLYKSYGCSTNAHYFICRVAYIETQDNLIILDDKPAPAAKAAQRPDGARGPHRGHPSGPSRGENNPSRGGRGPPPSHRPTRSQEEALRARRMQERGPSNGDRSLLDSPQKRTTERRPRRNSESSIMGAERPLTEEERRAKELRRRERERRHRDGKDKDSKSGKPSRKLDLIDQLDATSIYGTGCEYHDPQGTWIFVF